MSTFPFLCVSRKIFTFWSRSSSKSTCRQSTSSSTLRLCLLIVGQTRPQRSSEPESSSPRWPLSNTTSTRGALRQAWRSMWMPHMNMSRLMFQSWPLTFSVWHDDTRDDNGFNVQSGDISNVPKSHRSTKVPQGGCVIKENALMLYAGRLITKAQQKLRCSCCDCKFQHT